MQVINCPRCRKLFTKIKSPVCPACEKLEEEQFQELRKYVEENPMANVSQASEETGVSAKRILRYIREGRLIVPEGMKLEIRCTQCGAPITEGNFCDSCSKKMIENLSGVYGAPAPSTPAKKPGTDRKGHSFYTRN